MNQADAPTGLAHAAWQGLLAHDLKNALGLLESRLEALSLAPDARQAGLAHQECRRLRQHLVALLTVTRAGTGTELLAWPTADDPLALMHSVARLARNQRPELSITVHEDPETPMEAVFDAHLVRMALDAAINNALRFARTRIDLRVGTHDRATVWQVEDDGPGLGGEPQWTPPGIGLRSTGLGTALCKAVAAAHGCGTERGQATLGPARHKSGVCFELRIP